MRTSDAYLERFLSLHPKLIDLSLGRTERLLAKLGNPEARLPPVIHVAGTNGKGSTIAFLRAMLEAAGKRVHVYTSPHLVRFHERIRLAGTLVSEAELVAAFGRVEAANAGEPITFFEITTAVAFDLFVRHPADVILLEVGLGGRFDSTNVIRKPALAVITPVSMDHREFLGDTIEKIAFEKAGIIKRGTPLILAQQNERAVAVCLEVAAKLGVEALVGGQDFHAFEENGRLVYQDADALLDLPLPRLFGRHQHGNAATAIAALRRLFGEDIPVTAIEAGLQNVEWPARFQRLTGALTKLAPAGSEIWLDGAHNADGASVLGEALVALEEKSPRPLILIMATMARKDPKELLAPFVGLAQEFFAVRFDQDGARPANELMAEARAQGLPAALAGTVEDTLRFLAARDWSTPPRIVIGGSLYLAGEVLAADGSLPQ
ncbi:MAG: bifunctional folylpolyglutamate synthase/dihydrofolate synthase [Methylobacterium sp.]|nr:MAG: bifunctional folylpolyglutamate synthase/dihydrofolate synthase [Methylobacterium sp.]